MITRRVNPWLVLVIVGLAQFMVILDATIVNVALPSIQRGLHFSTGDLQWVVNAYALSFGGFLLLGGRAGDLFGRRRLFAIGIIVFSLASLFNGFATSSVELIVGRALQGLGGALVSPAALSTLTTTFGEGRARTRALGVWSAISVGGGSVGLLVGGILTQLASWQWVFFVNVPIGIATLLLAFRLVPESRAPEAEGRVDVQGAVLITAGLMTLVYAIVNAQSAGWVSTQTAGLGVLAAALLAGFVVVETRQRHPLFRLGMLRMRALTGANSVMLLTAGGMFSMFFFASIYVQEVLGYSPLRAGLAFLPVATVIAFGAGLAQVLIPTLGVRTVPVLGMAIAAAGLALMARIPVAGSYTTDLLPALMTTMLGMGLTFVPITLMATGGVAPAEAGLASGLINTAQQIGGALGLAVLSTLAANATTGTLATAGGTVTPALRATALVGGFHVAFLAGAALLVAGALLLPLLVRNRHMARVEVAAEVPVAA